MLMVYFGAVITMVTATSTRPICMCFHQCCGNYCGKVLLSLMLVTMCFCTNIGIKDKRNCRRGTITPRNPYFLEGEDIHLICNRNKGSSKHLAFVHGKNSDWVPQTYITRINETAIQLKIPNITAEAINATGYNVQYRCVKKNNPSKCFDNVYVQLEYVLRIPDNLQCRDYNFNEMKCTWSHGVEYHWLPDMNITCDYKMDKTELLYNTFDEIWRPCKNLTSTSCYWNETNYPAPESTIDVRVSVTNTVRNTTKTITKTFYKYEIVEPGPVTKLREHFNSSKSRCVQLTWRPPISSRSFKFIVMYESNCSSKQEMEVLYYTGKRISEITSEICNLVPKTQYIFIVNGRIIRRETNGSFTEWGHWSKPSFLNVMTKEDVPDETPSTFPGLYELSKSTGQMSDKDIFSLKIYWNPLQECQLHDSANHVTYTLSTKNESKKVNHPSFMAEIKVPKQSIFNVTLQAASSVGFSPTSQVITVYESSLGLQRSKLIVLYNRTSDICVKYAEIEIKDKSSEFANITHAIVWCEGKYDCQKQIQWRVLKNKTSYVFPGQLCGLDYRYGLVTYGYHKAQGQVVNTGIQWETCIYQSGKVPDKRLENFKVASQMKNGFEVEWTPYDCEVMEALIVKYMITYCKTDERDNCSCENRDDIKNVTTESRSYRESNLEAGSLYCVQLRAVSKAGLGPVNSCSVQIEKADSSMSLSIILGSICSVIVILVGCISFRYCCSRYQKVKKELLVTVQSTEEYKEIVNLFPSTSTNESNSGYEYMNNTSAGTEVTNLEGQPSIDDVDDEVNDIDGYKDPTDVEATDTGYNEENSEQIPEEQPFSRSSDHEEESLLLLQKLQAPVESHAIYGIGTINVNSEQDIDTNIVNDHLLISIKEDDAVCSEELNSDKVIAKQSVNEHRGNENIEMQSMSFEDNNHKYSNMNGSVDSEDEDEISLNKFIEQGEKSEDIYVHSGSTVLDESDKEDNETELHEFFSHRNNADEQIISHRLPVQSQSKVLDIDSRNSNSCDHLQCNSEDLLGNQSCQTTVIQRSAISDDQDFEINDCHNSNFSQSGKTSYSDNDSDIEGIEDIDDKTDEIGGYKRTSDVVEMSDSEWGTDVEEGTEMDNKIADSDVGGYKKSEDVLGISESEEEVEGDDTLLLTAHQNKPEDSVEALKIEVLRNGIVKNGVINILAETDKVRNNSLSGSDNSLTSTAGSGHGSSSAVSYVRAGNGGDINVKENKETLNKSNEKIPELNSNILQQENT